MSKSYIRIAGVWQETVFGTPGGTPPATVPGAPTSVTAIAGDAEASVSWTAPSSNGGSTLTGYVVTSSPGNITANAGPNVTTTVVTGLTNNTAYTFTVKAVNAVGQSVASSPSASVTPTVGGSINGITLGTLQLSTTSSSVTADWTVTVNAPTTFTYMQIAVRLASDPGASSGPDFGYNNNVTVTSTTAFNATKTLAAGDYVARIAYNTTGNAGDWVNGPNVAFTITSVTPPPATRSVQLIGLSGLPWNAGLFYQGGSLSAATAFGNWRGRPVDAIMYFTPRATWNDLLWLHDDLDDYQGLRIVVLPTQPTSMNNSSTAAGSNNAFWVNYGQQLSNRGWNDGRTVLRLNWEYNINNPYGGNKPNAANFRDAYRNVVNSVRVHAPNTIFNLCANKGPDQIDGIIWTECYPGDDYVDVIGLDWYDHWGKITNTSEYNTELARNPGGASVADFARAHNKMISLDEWGVSHWSGGVGGGDNPFYIQKMFDFMTANADILAWENTYNDPGAPPDLDHVLFSGNPAVNGGKHGPNQNSAQKYLDLWGN